MDEPSWSTAATARHAFVAAAVVLAVVVVAVALWQLKVVLALLLLGVTVAAAMRPGIDRLASWRIPRPVGVLIHYAAILALVALFLSFVVPTLTDQVQAALHAAQTHHPGSGNSLKAKVLDALARRLHHLPSADRLVQPALSIGEEAVKVLVGILFTFAVAAYWIFERERTVDLVTSFLPRPKRKTVRDTWTLIDQKLGAFVRGELVLIAFVATLASVALFLVGEPYWLLIGIAAGILEIVPVVGPLAALALTVGAGLTVSWHTAVFAGIALLAIRILEDYLVTPRVLGGAVGLSPLLTLVAVSVTGVLLGGFYVLLSVPIASLVATVVDVALRGVDPADVDVPTVIFPSQDAG
ncbi:MAG TPA: AI-2E family transporter [Gaiellaceae bacterium]|jgi:predicted PurR-regulated permease PerM